MKNKIILLTLLTLLTNPTTLSAQSAPSPTTPQPQEDVIILPPNRTHILRSRQARNFTIPGDWTGCRVYRYSSLMQPANTKRPYFHLVSTSSPDGIVRISPDPSKCPEGGYYLKGELISPNHIQVGKTRYTINLKGEITHQSTIK